ncbi:MAG: helix-turn-helix domain-containing protein [Planctomycetota bacterium]
MSASESGHNPGTANGQGAKAKGSLTRARVSLTSARAPKAPTLPRRLYDIQAVADYLGIPPYSVRGLIWNGSLPCVKIGRRQYVDLRDVDQFIEQSKTREK